eukprot:scaffold30_cov329-Pavlova_lutheri.AAC.1
METQNDITGQFWKKCAQCSRMVVWTNVFGTLPWNIVLLSETVCLANLMAVHPTKQFLNPTETTGKLDAKSKPGHFVGFEPVTKDTYQKPTASPDDTQEDITPMPTASETLEPVSLGERQNSTIENVELPEHETTEGTEDAENISNTAAEERRYPLRERRPPHPYWTANVCLTDPLTLDEALGSPQHDDWKLALQEEVSSLSEQDVFDVVDRTPLMKTLPCKWVFKVKYDQDGNIQRFKARLVAKGFKQVAGIDFGETFAPVAKQSTLRILWTLAAKRDWKVENIDIKTAFLNGDLDEEIYMDMPLGFQLDGKVWKLKKTLYGLKQAPRAWHIKLTDVLEKLGFRCSTADPGLYVGEDMLLMVYVDDLLLCGNGRSKVENVKQSLLATFEGRDLGPTDHFLGIKMERDRTGKTVFLSQESYVNNVLERFRMADCYSVSTPLELGTKWTSDATATESNFPYQELVGCLMYLAVSTRPDIAYATNRLARYVSAPTSNHVVVVKRVLKYLHGTKAVGILVGDSSPSLLEGYCDANYGDCEETRRSTTGYVFTLHGSLVSWQTKLQKTVAVSTTESKYMAAASAAKEALYLRKVLNDIGFGAQCITIHCDNQGAVNLTKNALTVSLTEHVDIAHHFVRNCVSRGELKLKYISTNDQLADFLTKALGPTKLQAALKTLGLLEYQAMSRGEC